MEHNKSMAKMESQQLEQVLTPAAFSQKLLQCLVNLGTPAKAEAKMELVLMANELMPGGKPQYLAIVKYPTIRKMVETEGKKKMLAILALLVKDFCSSVNVIRNMNEDQMIEAGAMLLEECGNFRMEDYLMMFNMAKRGAFSEVKILDRIDIQLISAIIDAYWQRRNEAGQKAIDAQVKAMEGELPGIVDRVDQVWVEGKGYQKQKTMEKKFEQFADVMGGVIKSIKENFVTPQELDNAKKMIIQNPDYKNPYSKPDEN